MTNDDLLFRLRVQLFARAARWESAVPVVSSATTVPATTA